VNRAWPAVAAAVLVVVAGLAASPRGALHLGIVAACALAAAALVWTVTAGVERPGGRDPQGAAAAAPQADAPRSPDLSPTAVSPAADAGSGSAGGNARGANGAALGLAGIVDALPVGVIALGAGGRIDVFNAAAGEIFGVSPERARGRALIEIVRNSELDRRVAATIREGARDTAAITHPTSGAERHLVVTTLPHPALGPGGVLIIVSDMTRVRELEALRREFVSNVSHELRTPLTAVKLMVETLQSGVDKAAREQFLNSIAQEIERMIALVEDLLDLARLESGKLELRLGRVDVGEVCRQAVRAQEARAQAGEVRLACELPAEGLEVTADRDKLAQVLTNLLDNALRHTPPGGNVTVRTYADGDAAVIEVADTGSGIPSTALAHIFERFYVVDPARARGRSGTGLGLAIVKHIVEAHRGSVSAESELGAGSRFICRLPRDLQIPAHDL
jgi:two-component system phosphate regulon sensor histidine kinase PhoR